jgi:hypothetical protein
MMLTRHDRDGPWNGTPSANHGVSSIGSKDSLVGDAVTLYGAYVQKKGMGHGLMEHKKPIRQRFRGAKPSGIREWIAVSYARELSNHQLDV